MSTGITFARGASTACAARGCRERAAVPIVSSWHRRKGFDVVRASWPPDLRSNEQAA
jgi:hypothetical protein